MTAAFDEAKKYGFRPINQSTSSSSTTAAVAAVPVAPMAGLKKPLKNIITSSTSFLPAATSSTTTVVPTPAKKAETLVTPHSAKPMTKPTSSHNVPVTTTAVANTTDKAMPTFKARAMPNFGAIHNKLSSKATTRIIHTPKGPTATVGKENDSNKAAKSKLYHTSMYILYKVTHNICTPYMYILYRYI